METLLIELQDIRDAKVSGISHHRSAAVSVIEQGGVVNVTNHGQPVGQAKTIEELDRLLG